MTTKLLVYHALFSDPNPYLTICSRIDGQSAYEGCSLTAPLTQDAIDKLREGLDKAEKFLKKHNHRAEVEARIKAELDAEV